MKRPTREEVEAARVAVEAFVAHLERFEDNRRAEELKPALRTILAEIKPPTDEELAEEAVARFGVSPAFSGERVGYAAGARREGRK